MKSLPLFVLLLASCGFQPDHIGSQLRGMSNDQLRTEYLIIETKPELWIGPRRDLTRAEMRRRGLLGAP